MGLYYIWFSTYSFEHEAICWILLLGIYILSSRTEEKFCTKDNLELSIRWVCTISGILLINTCYFEHEAICWDTAA